MLVPAAITSLPMVKTLADCASYSKSVEPYLPQLYELPNKLLSQYNDPSALASSYASTNPIISALAFSIALFPIFLVVSEINKNYSQVDRVWSILPTLYNAHYAYWARLNGLDTQKVDNVLIFSAIWTARLTFNYWRKGGYEIGSEDYRWKLIENWIGQPAFFLLNVLFTSSIQSVLLMAVTTPAYVLLLTSRLSPRMDTADVVFARVLISLIVFEFIADNQQWRYHSAKAEYAKTAKPPPGYSRAQLDRGFNTTGMFKYSRHPNFAAEQAIWATLYAWGAYATGEWMNWTAAGMVSYLGVFAGSTPLTEYISSEKYPEYSVYQQRVGKFLPWPFGSGWSEEEMKTLGPKIAQEQKRGKK